MIISLAEPNKRPLKPEGMRSAIYGVFSGAAILVHDFNGRNSFDTPISPSIVYLLIQIIVLYGLV